MTTIATLFKRFALWKAQEGATVAELEQYQASTSLPGTLKMIVLLRAFSWTSVGLVALWSWFYLGSQAVSREYQLALSKDFTSQELVFPSAEALSSFEGSVAPTPMEIIRINSAFMGAMQVNSQILANNQLLATQKNSPSVKLSLPYYASDPYDAALIPLWEQMTYPDSSLGLSNPGRDGYRTVLELGAAYTANSGTPVLLRNRSRYEFCLGNITECGYLDYRARFMGKFTISTSYIFPNCSDVIFSGPEAFPSKAMPFFTTFLDSTNRTVLNPNNPTGPELPTIDIWQRDYVFTNKTVRGRCSLSRKHVDVKVECDNLRCVSTHVRPTPKPPVSKTPFDDPVYSKRFFYNLLTSAGTPGDNEMMSNALDGGLQYTNVTYYDDANKTDGKWHWESSHYSIYNTSVQLSLSQTLTIMINTYMTASQINGALDDPAEAFLILDDDTTKALFADPKKNGNGMWGGAREVHGAKAEAVWIIFIHWIILDYVTCTILLLSAIASVWLRLRTVCPDVFGYVSSMTRDNPHLPVPMGGSTMSGTERARAMKNVRVKIGEVERQDGLPGHIGLALEHPEIPLGKLRRKGEYL